MNDELLSRIARVCATHSGRAGLSVAEAMPEAISVLAEIERTHVLVPRRPVALGYVETGIHPDVQERWNQEEEEDDTILTGYDRFGNPHYAGEVEEQ